MELCVFRVSKDTSYFSTWPQFHWTSQKIWVHTYICYAAMALAEVLRMKLCMEDVEMSRLAMLDRLHEVREGLIIYGGKTVKRADGEHSRIWNATNKVCGIDDD